MRFGPCIAVAFLALLSVASWADTTSPVGGSGGGFSGSGTLYATDNGNGSYTITGIAGTGVTGLIGPEQFDGNDNLLYPNSTPALDENGFAFTDIMGNTSFQVDLGYSSATDGYQAYILDSDNVQMTIPVMFSLGGTQTEHAMFAGAFAESDTPATKTFNFSVSPAVAATPEPSSLALLGTGFVGLVGVVHRRKRC